MMADRTTPSISVSPYFNTYVTCTAAAIGTALSGTGLRADVGRLLAGECPFFLLKSSEDHRDFVMGTSLSPMDTLRAAGIQVGTEPLPPTRDEIWPILRLWLDRGYPVLVSLDVYNFRYSSLYHVTHTPHLTVISGYSSVQGSDGENDFSHIEVAVADSIGGCGTMPLDELLDGMWSTHSTVKDQPRLGGWSVLLVSEHDQSPQLTNSEIETIVRHQVLVSNGDEALLNAKQHAYFGRWLDRLDLKEVHFGIRYAFDVADKIEHQLPSWEPAELSDYLDKKFDEFALLVERRWLHGNFLAPYGGKWQQWANYYLSAANEWKIASNLCRKASRRRDITLLPRIAQRIKEGAMYEELACRLMDD